MSDKPICRNRGGRDSNYLGRNYSWFQNCPECLECNDDRPHLSGCHSGTTSMFVSGRHGCWISVYGRQRPSSPCKHCRRMPSIGGYHPYGLASILSGLEFNRACVGYTWLTNCSPSTPSHLSTGTSEGIVLDEWCNIPQDQIDNLILSVPRRCKAWIVSSGRHTPY
ncbi:uncharacterized protein TNCV_2075941 [Trichonephila clavipes]|nr:uncharacterized protein TNCV_2075941 [Trichonephila clavipes]